MGKEIAGMLEMYAYTYIQYIHIHFACIHIVQACTVCIYIQYICMYVCCSDIIELTSTFSFPRHGSCQSYQLQSACIAQILPSQTEVTSWPTYAHTHAQPYVYDALHVQEWVICMYYICTYSIQNG